MKAPKAKAPPPIPPPPPPPPTPTDQGVLDARNDQQRRARASRGSTSTILAGMGGADSSPILGGKTLLGA